MQNTCASCGLLTNPKISLRIVTTNCSSGRKSALRGHGLHPRGSFQLLGRDYDDATRAQHEQTCLYDGCMNPELMYNQRQPTSQFLLPDSSRGTFGPGIFSGQINVPNATKPVTPNPCPKPQSSQTLTPPFLTPTRANNHNSRGGVGVGGIEEGRCPTSQQGSRSS